MANQEQLDILNQGVKAWMQWRVEHISSPALDPEEWLELASIFSNQKIPARKRLPAKKVKTAAQPDMSSEKDLFGRPRVDFRDADLSNRDLAGVDFSEVDLRGSNLSHSDLSGANLQMATVHKADFSYTLLRKADCSWARFHQAVLNYADLTQANLMAASFMEAILAKTTMVKANLFGAELLGANLLGANLQGANLTGADLSLSTLVGTRLGKAILDDCNIYGCSVWDVIGVPKSQKNLIISGSGKSFITVDNIKVAQFVNLILNNAEIRDAIDILTSKSVLILGRFALAERKAILDALRNKLREFNLLPVVFDFDRPTDKDFTETIKTLAGLAYFVIADVTNPKSSPLELQATVPDYQIPFVPIIQEGEDPFAMMADLQKKYSWVLDTVSYNSEKTLMEILKPLIIDPAMEKRQELRVIKAQKPEVISGKDFLKKGKKEKK